MLKILKAIDSSLRNIEVEIKMVAKDKGLSLPLWYMIKRFPKAFNILIFERKEDAEKYDRRHKIWKVCKNL